MKINIKLLIAIVLGVLLTPCFITGQENPDVLTLERIYKEKEFRLNHFGPAVWLEDGSGYTTLEKSDKFPEAEDIIKYDPSSEERAILVNAAQLIPKDEQSPLLISKYQWFSLKYKLYFHISEKHL